MRLLFAVLLAANIALLAWALRKAPVQDALHHPQAQRGNLELLTESHATAGSTATNCVVTGPIQEPTVLAGLRRTLVQQGLSPKIVEHSRLEPLGYWVYLPPAATLDAAQEVGRTLRQKGVDDFVYVVGAEKANAISLGLFATQGEANALVLRLQRLGFSPLQEQRFARRTETFLSVPGTTTPPLIAGVPPWRSADCQYTEESLP